MKIATENMLTIPRHLMSPAKVEHIEQSASLPGSRLGHIVWDKDFPMQYAAVFYLEGLDGGHQSEVVEIFQDPLEGPPVLDPTPIEAAIRLAA